ncbi:contact-dependent growth inhibition system immunity protein [Brevibacillus sp. HB2.2]|uniref:contact-dependent growth inhibition system immunity protein n=1 Tax=Brevibacillus sp. HB2.2 TaxID=2738846 RepID=UPI001C2CBBDD|nr:contact-dependent growth inhibition system immunity protein [Brevibacillus sp. HB2.2]
MTRIKDIYFLSENQQKAEAPYALDEWYNRLINKTVDEVDVKDICRMLSQNIFIDLGIKKAWEILEEDPLAGDIYDGQLLELLYKIELDRFDDLTSVGKLLHHIHTRVPHLEWLSDEDQQEYTDLLIKFKRKVIR